MRFNLKGKKKIIFLAAAVVAAGVLIGMNLSRLLPILQVLFEWVGRQGWKAPLFFILFYVLGALLFLPQFVFSVSAGFLFGVIPGVLTVSAGAMLLAAGTFMAGRYGDGRWISEKIERSHYLKEARKAVRGASWSLVVLTRLAVLFPFIVINYAYGLSGISFKEFIFGSGLGMLPGIFLYVSLGSMAGSLIGLQNRQTPLEQWIFYAAGIAASFGVTVYMAAFIKKNWRHKKVK